MNGSTHPSILDVTSHRGCSSSLFLAKLNVTFPTHESLIYFKKSADMVKTKILKSMGTVPPIMLLTGEGR